MTPRRRSPGPRGRKVSVEIYFLLYLSAIILLLGTTHSRNGAHDDALEEAVMQLLAPDFRVGADRAVMIYRFLPPGTAVRTASGLQLRRDSINVIRAVGSFADVRFQLVAIEDTSTGVSLPLDNAVLTRQGDRMAVFSWRPRNVRENAVYRVTVRATAIPLPPSSIIRPDVRAKIAEVLRRRGSISDSVSFTVNVFALTNPGGLLLTGTDPGAAGGPGSDSGGSSLTRLSPSGAISAPGQPFEMTVAQPTIHRAPRAQWRNRIVFAGTANAMRDLDVQVMRGAAQISERTATWIELSGAAPASGRQEVVVRGTRRSDGRAVQASFTVEAASLEAMSVPQTFYAGQMYAIDLRSSSVPNDQISIEVAENDRVVIPRSEGGAVVNYRPTALGKVRVTRYVGGELIDETIAEIRPLPAPSLAPQRVSGSSDEAIVQTISYGTIRGEANRVQLKIQEGNADDPEELIKEYKYDEKSLRHIQYWRVRKGGSGEFSFKAYALDRRGSNGGKSNSVSYSGISGK